MSKFNSFSRKTISILALLLFSLAFMVMLVPTTYAKAVAIQNESVNMLVVNGTTGNILLNPNAGFGNVRIRE